MGRERLSRREFLERTFKTGVGAIASAAVPPFLQNKSTPGRMIFSIVGHEQETNRVIDDLPFWEDIEHFTEHFAQKTILPKLDAFGDTFKEALKPVGFSPTEWKINIHAATNVAVLIADSYRYGLLNGLFVRNKEAEEHYRTDFYQIASALAALMRVYDRYEHNPDEFQKIINSYASGRFRNKQNQRIDALLGLDINQFSAPWAHLGWHDTKNFLPFGWLESSGTAVIGRSPSIELLSGFRLSSELNERLIPETAGDNYVPGIVRIVNYELLHSRISDQLNNFDIDDGTLPPEQPADKSDTHRPYKRPQRMKYENAPPEIQKLFTDYAAKHGLDRVVPLIKYITLNFGTFARYNQQSRVIELNAGQIKPENITELDVLVKVGIGHEFTHAVINNLVTGVPAEISQPLILERERLMGSLADFTDPSLVLSYPGTGIFWTGELATNNQSWRTPTSAMVFEYPLYQYLILENRYAQNYPGFMTLINRTILFLEDIADEQNTNMTQLPVYRLFKEMEAKTKNSKPTAYATFTDFYAAARSRFIANDISPFERLVMAGIEEHLPAFDKPKKHIFYPQDKTSDEWADYVKKIVIPSTISHLVFSRPEAELLKALHTADCSPQVMRRAIKIYKQSAKGCLDVAREELWAQLVGLGLLMRDDPHITPDPSVRAFNLPAVMNLFDQMLQVCVEYGVAREESSSPRHV